MIKKFIRGNNTRGAEVIKALEDLGGLNKAKLHGIHPDRIYIINRHDNSIDMWDDTSDYAILIQECFEEIKLPEKKVITNIDVAKWYFHVLRDGHAVQFMCGGVEGRIFNHPWNYQSDYEKTDVKKVRVDFGEWIPIEEAGII